MTARITEAARADIQDAAQGYEGKSDGLGAEFTDRVLEAIGRIEANPLGYAKVIGEARRADLHQFPYSLWFRVEGDAIIIACLHDKRSPELAKERALGIPPLA